MAKAGAKSATPTSFKPGKSGNPSGRSKLNAEVTELAKQESVAAFMRIVAISKESEDRKLQLAANVYIVDRACGKPAQAITGEGGGPIEVTVTVREKKV